MDDSPKSLAGLPSCAIASCQWSMVLWGAASYLCSTAQSVDALIVYRVLLGIGMGM
ncbi:MFS transporter, partial [Burkholderia pseudomallei]|nr:MFS transporter [Burkholderia pseudomallei]MBF3726624.1 MFS transporter [Burkholderia pseudomallei]MBF3850183.1 MFS transporter [Burkholderia pseudomallei]